MKIQIKLLLFDKSNITHFGLFGCCHGAKWGSHTTYYYGIKYLFLLKIRKVTGECINWEL